MNSLREKTSKVTNFLKRKPGVFALFSFALGGLGGASLLLVRESSFLRDFAANFLSDLLVGGGLAWWLARQLDLEERRLERESERKEHLGKKGRFIALLANEVKTIQDKLPQHIEIVQTHRAGQILDLWQLAPFWDVVRRDEDLPRLLGAFLLLRVSLFYSELDQAKRTRELLLQLQLSLDPGRDLSKEWKEKTLVAGILASLKRAQNQAPGLFRELQKENKAIDAQLPQGIQPTDMT